MGLKRRGASFAALLAAGLVLALAGPTGWTRLPAWTSSGSDDVPIWSATDVALLRTLSLDALPERPADPSNAFAADPGAAALGQRLFFDRRLSSGHGLSCASCHQPEQAFTDGRRVAQGLQAGQRNTPTLLGVAHHRSFHWDGRIDTLWGQALGPIENAAEMGSTRTEVVRLVAEDASLRAAFDQVFGPLDPALVGGLPKQPCGPVAAAVPADVNEGSQAGEPVAARCWRALRADQRAAVTRTFVQVGKALAAYETTLRPTPTRFDQFVRDLAAGDARAAATRLTPAEQRGLRLFISAERTACLNCHNGPLLSNGGFHDIGTNLGQQATMELGRMLGSTLMAAAEFRCDGDHSDALAEQCQLARFQADEAAGHGRGAFKVPSLRGVSRTAPFMHDGRFADLAAVLRHYRSPPLLSVPGAHELRPLELSDRDVDDLNRFLQTL